MGRICIRYAAEGSAEARGEAELAAKAEAGALWRLGRL